MDADGTFRHEGAPVEHPRVVDMLRRGLGRAPDGRPVVRFGTTWAYLEAAGDLYRITSVALEPWEAPVFLRARLDDDTDEQVDLVAGSVGLRPDGVLALRVKDGTEWATCLRAAHAVLGALVAVDGPATTLETGRGPVPVVEVDGRGTGLGDEAAEMTRS
jgi:hypothetical protein